MAATEEVGQSSSSSDPMVGVDKPRGRLRKYVRKAKRIFLGDQRSKYIAQSTASTSLALALSTEPLPSIERTESSSHQIQDATVAEASRSSTTPIELCLNVADETSSGPVSETTTHSVVVPPVIKRTVQAIPPPVIQCSDRISPDPELLQPPSQEPTAERSTRISPEPILERPRKFSPDLDVGREPSPLGDVGGEPYDLEAKDWAYPKRPTNVSRVERPIRARIHRTCHRCNTGFGATRVCGNCGHTRCKLCPRSHRRAEDSNQPGTPTEVGSPAALSPQDENTGAPDEEEAPAAQETAADELATTAAGTVEEGPTASAVEERPAEEEHGNASVAIGGIVGGIDLDVDDFETLRQKYIMSRMNRTGGQLLVKKRPMQRVRRTCHECQALFQPTSRVCTKCEHVRCDDCPRDPPKRSKYPHGYPGDAPRLIHRTCHYCSYAFPPIPRVPGSGNRNVDANGEPIECTNCGHIQCMECPIELPNHYHVPPSPVVETSGRSRVAQDGPIAAGISGS